MNDYKERKKEIKSIYNEANWILRHIDNCSAGKTAMRQNDRAFKRAFALKKEARRKEKRLFRELMKEE